MSYFNDGCKRLFGFDIQIKNIQTQGSAILKALKNKPEAKQILFTNGSVDPWMTVSITPSLAKLYQLNLKTVLIQRASHTEDLGDSRDPEVLKTQALILKTFKSWVNQKR
jgi:hypothetical protein